MKKTTLIEMAEDTLDILEKGFYLNQKQEKIDISAVQQKAVQNSTLYKEEEFEALILKRNQLFNTQPTFQTHFEVLPNTTLECCFELSKTQNKIFCLNFASARNEGGGFLNGAKAQEESLARSSGLYPCLTKFHYQFYQMHRDFKSTYYTSNMIFSPNVPIFKNDDGDLLDNFYEISFLTSPAVNVGSLKTQGNFKQEKYEKIMLERMEFLLTIAYLEKYEDLVLGAWGCGAFGNDPVQVVEFFAKHLLYENALFKNRFKNIYFAICAPFPNDRNIPHFRKVFAE